MCRAELEQIELNDFGLVWNPQMYYSCRSQIPTLRGIFHPLSGEGIGFWAMSSTNSSGSRLKGQFEFKRKNKPLAMSNGSPLDMFVSGVFTIIENGEVTHQLPEAEILLRFQPVPNNPSLFSLRGTGFNAFGRFHMFGTYNLKTLALKCERAYLLHENSLPMSMGRFASIPAVVPSPQPLFHTTSHHQHQPQLMVGLFPPIEKRARYFQQ